MGFSSKSLRVAVQVSVEQDSKALSKHFKNGCLDGLAVSAVGSERGCGGRLLDSSLHRVAQHLLLQIGLLGSQGQGLLEITKPIGTLVEPPHLCKLLLVCSV